MKKFFSLFLLVSLVGYVQAQRFVAETFTDVDVTTDVMYGVNATVLLLGTAGEAVPQPLVCDIYEPSGDTETERPLVLVFHTGNFLPPQVNGGCTGTNKDANVVETCTRLAKMGYVAASPAYRLGWNPADPDQTARIFQLINAAYRGVQDSRTAVRFFKKTAAEDGNPYGIDPGKIAMVGYGTGGYVTYGSATLDTITDTFIPKFVTPAGPMVFEPFNGNVEGTTVGVIPPTGVPGLPFPPNDTLCYPNHVSYDDDFQLAVAIGGACGDTSWVDPDDTPIIGIQVPTDPFAPCGIGTVLVPPPLNLPVVEVMGSCTIIPLANDEGVNDVIDHPFIDDVSTYVQSVNGGVAGFYPVFSSDPTEGSPWFYTNGLEPYGIPDTDCDTAYFTGAKPYMDSIFTYLAPRMCLALDLGCDLGGFSNDNEVLSPADVGLNVFPNPAAEAVRFTSDGAYPISAIYVYDMNGRLVKAHTNLSLNQFTMQRHSLPDGTYLAKVIFEDGFVTQKILFR